MTAAVLFGGGCFWCIEPAFSALKGVSLSQAGYSGGTTPYPTYEQVCSQKTGHIEVVQVRYDSDVIDFETLLKVFFSLHDPTTLDRQGHDIGSQYASAIFYTTAEQQKQAADYIKKLEEKLQKPVVTKLQPAQVFWPAEPEHYNYYLNNSFAPYSVNVIQPKLRAFMKSFEPLIKDPREALKKT